MVVIPGVKVEQQKRSIHCSINDFSDELKQLIRDQLASVWNGFAEVENLPEIHSYKRTLNSFLDRYRSKAETTKKGMIGELLAHVLIGQIVSEFTSLSVLKNKEERSIKKGFDIIYFEDITTKLWYSEVKAGRGKSGTPSEYNTILLERSHTSISDMFLERRASLWESALIDVNLTIKNSKGKIQLSKLLDQDSPVHNKDEKKNVMLISVLYRCPTDPVEMESIIEFFDRIKSQNCYLDIILFSIQKKMFELVANFLEIEAA